MEKNRTFKQLTKRHRNIVRALVEDLARNKRKSGYEEKDICDVMRLSPKSIATLKANLTRKK